MALAQRSLVVGVLKTNPLVPRVEFTDLLFRPFTQMKQFVCSVVTDNKNTPHNYMRGIFIIVPRNVTRPFDFLAPHSPFGDF